MTELIEKIASFTEPHVIVIGGPAGCGKTTIGKQLSELLQVDFVEGDDLHSAKNLEKMSNGIPLTDEDREPWLKLISQKSSASASQNRNKLAVISCSMLKKQYRAQIKAESPNTKFVFVFIYTSYEELLQRVSQRANHYMKNDMVKSQYDIMEIPSQEEGISINVQHTSKDQVLEQVLGRLEAYL